MSRLNVTILGAGVMGQLLGSLITLSPRTCSKFGYCVDSVTLESHRSAWVTNMNSQGGVWFLQPQPPDALASKVGAWFQDRSGGAVTSTLAVQQNMDAVFRKACLAPVQFQLADTTPCETVSTKPREDPITHIIFITTKGQPQLQAAACRASDILFGTPKFPGLLRPIDQAAIVCMMNGAGHDVEIRRALASKSPSSDSASPNADLLPKARNCPSNPTHPNVSVIIGTTALSCVMVNATKHDDTTHPVQALNWTGWGETVLAASETDAWDEDRCSPKVGTPSHATWALLNNALSFDLAASTSDIVAPLKCVPASEREAVIWTKLTANVIINQLTAVLDMPNGALLPWLDCAIQYVEANPGSIVEALNPAAITVGDLKRSLDADAGTATPNTTTIVAILVGLSRELAGSILSDKSGLVVDANTGQVVTSKTPKAVTIPSKPELQLATLGILRKARSIASSTQLNISSMLSDVRRQREHATEAGGQSLTNSFPWATENSYIGEYAAKRAAETLGSEDAAATLMHIAKLVSEIPAEYASSQAKASIKGLKSDRKSECDI